MTRIVGIGRLNGNALELTIACTAACRYYGSVGDELPKSCVEQREAVMSVARERANKLGLPIEIWGDRESGGWIVAVVEPASVQP